jgi:hypothetical protein
MFYPIVHEELRMSFHVPITDEMHVIDATEEHFFTAQRL